MDKELKNLLKEGKRYAEEYWDGNAIADLCHRAGAIWAMKAVKERIVKAMERNKDITVRDVLYFIDCSIQEKEDRNERL